MKTNSVALSVGGAGPIEWKIRRRKDVNEMQLSAEWGGKKVSRGNIKAESRNYR